MLMRSSLAQVCVCALREKGTTEAGVGTGGTIAGTGQFLKSMNEDVLVVLADPEGSGLYNKV